jgi:hypothetical protein
MLLQNIKDKGIFVRTKLISTWRKWAGKVKDITLGGVIGIIVTLMTFVSTTKDFSEDFPELINSINKYVNFREYQYDKLNKIRPGYTLKAIEGIMESVPQVQSSWKLCNEYSWISDNFILQIATDKNDVSYSYSVISLEKTFNYKPFFTDSLVLNKTTFSQVANSFRKAATSSFSRGQNGSYYEFHSNLGGTTNYISVHYTLNLNYYDAEIYVPSISEEEIYQQNYKQEIINSFTYSNYNYTSSDFIFGKPKELDACNASYGKDVVLMFNGKDDF